LFWLISQVLPELRFTCLQHRNIHQEFYGKISTWTVGFRVIFNNIKLEDKNNFFYRGDWPRSSSNSRVPLKSCSSKRKQGQHCYNCGGSESAKEVKNKNMTVFLAAHFVNFIWYDIVLPIGFSPGLYGLMELYASSICRTRTILELFFLLKSCRIQARSQRFHLLTSWAIRGGARRKKVRGPN